MPLPLRCQGRGIFQVGGHDGEELAYEFVAIAIVHAPPPPDTKAAPRRQVETQLL